MKRHSLSLRMLCSHINTSTKKADRASSSPAMKKHSTLGIRLSWGELSFLFGGDQRQRIFSMTRNHFYHVIQNDKIHSVSLLSFLPYLIWQLILKLFFHHETQNHTSFAPKIVLSWFKQFCLAYREFSTIPHFYSQIITAAQRWGSEQHLSPRVVMKIN